VTIRNLAATDISNLMFLTVAAGWNQTAEDWGRLMSIDAGGCFGAEVDGRIVATSTLLRYESKLAWLGMVLTHPNYRNQGIARELVSQCLQLALPRTVRLDATNEGKRLYMEMGFFEECKIERWDCTAAPQVEAPKLEPVEASAQLDREVFGVNRIKLLQTMGSGALLEDGSYALYREGREAVYFGPCVSTSIENTRTLLMSALSKYPGRRFFWDLFPHHREVADLAREFGFVPARQLSRMVRTGHPTLPDPRYHAIAGFEFG
jgi:GNAT superfamily N-acetyltransferase